MVGAEWGHGRGGGGFVSENQGPGRTGCIAATTIREESRAYRTEKAWTLKEHGRWWGRLKHYAPVH